MTHKSDNLLAKLFLVFFFSICQSQQSIETLVPVDQSESDKSFFKFKTELVKALDEKNIDFIKKSLSNKVQIGFAPDEIGKKAFISKWLTKDKDELFWKEVKRILNMGCTNEKEGGVVYFACPYVYSRFPEDKDPFGWVAVTEKDVPVYADTGTSSKIIRHISYELLPFDGGVSKVWFKIQKSSNSTYSYIKRKFVHGPNNHRIIFRKENEKWVITSLIAGD